ncbi:DUF4124 domain-containing protein [Sulfuriflexus mobilis]|uniref:DUF4124 domain-containing protein n=1 Tax=Sulfuriflexus mobilis TaxID=1811807 RepID=UPI000F84CEF4|nr:DUF4124 domain-containing protein [Sulfuriflexus mobilis]
MKKLLLILLLLGLAAAVFFYLNPALRREATDLLKSSGLQPASMAVYKWRDTAGQWQYTQAPPPEGTPFERVEARSDVNVLPVPDELKNK